MFTRTSSRNLYDKGLRNGTRPFVLPADLHGPGAAVVTTCAFAKLHPLMITTLKERERSSSSLYGPTVIREHFCTRELPIHQGSLDGRILIATSMSTEGASLSGAELKIPAAELLGT